MKNLFSSIPMYTVLAYVAYSHISVLFIINMGLKSPVYEEKFLKISKESNYFFLFDSLDLMLPDWHKWINLS